VESDSDSSDLDSNRKKSKHDFSVGFDVTCLSLEQLQLMFENKGQRNWKNTWWIVCTSKLKEENYGA